MRVNRGGFQEIVTKINMAMNSTLNPLYEEIGKGFVQQYYALFDDPDQRHNIIHFFNVSEQLVIEILIIFLKFYFRVRGRKIQFDMITMIRQSSVRT